MATQGIVHITY